MNDRFKFRVWDKGNEHYVDYADLLYIEPSGEITYACYDGDREDMYYYEYNDVVVELCTGLRDKNGRLIFEGDIVRVYGKYQDLDLDEEIKVDYIDVVESLEKFFSEAMSKSIYNALGCDTLSVEVIGNIHENPELLEK